MSPELGVGISGIIVTVGGFIFVGGKYAQRQDTCEKDLINLRKEHRENHEKHDDRLNVHDRDISYLKAKRSAR